MATIAPYTVTAIKLAEQFSAGLGAGWIGGRGLAGEQGKGLWLQLRGQLLEGGAVEAGAAGPALQMQAFAQQVVEALTDPAGGVGEVTESGDEPGDPVGECGEEVMPYPTARLAGGEVGGVLHRRETTGGEGVVESLPPQVEQGAGQPTAPWLNAAQAEETTAEEPAQDQGFRLIVGMVGGEDRVDPEFVGHATKEAVTGSAGVDLGAGASWKGGGQVLKGEGDPELLG